MPLIDIFVFLQYQLNTKGFILDWLARAAVFNIFPLIRMIILYIFVSLYTLLRIYGTD